MPDIPPFVLKILDTLTGAGFPAYAVGGCVRDILMGRTPHDWDVATAAPVGSIAALFEKTVPTGIRYGTVTIVLPEGTAEVTTFRRDGEYLNGRRPESVEFVSDLAEDLARRDLTVNAMAMDASGRVIDPFGGRADLEAKILRCVGDPEKRFSEDALRMLRLLRFHAQLGFECEERSLAALKDLAPLAARLSAERVREELEKTLASPAPGVAALMIEYGLLSVFMSEKGKNIPWDRLSLAPAELRLPVFALLAGRAGAASSPEELMRLLRCPAKDVRAVREAESLTPDLLPDCLSLRLALAEHRDLPVLLAAAAGGFYPMAKAELEAGRFTRVSDLAVTGGDLSFLPGPETGRALRRLALAVTAGKLQNTRESLISAARYGNIP